MLGDLHKQRFDLGIGGMGMADSVLFRHLELPYLKISHEDIESYTIQVKLNMPVLTSAYPSSQIYAKSSYTAEAYDITSVSGFSRYLKSLIYRSQFAMHY